MPFQLPAALTWAYIVTMAAVFIPLAAGILVVALIVAVQAMWRGYPVVLWLLAGGLGNPIFLLVLLGAMPDYERMRQREEEIEDLRNRARRPVKRLPPVVAEAVDAPAALERSIGDEETRLGGDRAE